MMRPIFFITVAFALVVFSAPNARAGLCFQYTKSGGGIIVAPVDLPAPNKCVTFALYEQVINTPFTLLGAGTGSLCTSTNSPMVIFHYTYDACRPLGSNNYFESGTCRLMLDHNGNLPTQFSRCRGTLLTGKPGQIGKVGNFANTDDLVITKCDTNNDINFQVPSGVVDDCREFKLRQNFDQESQSPDQPSRGSDKP
jgi:hypothetical protein